MEHEFFDNCMDTMKRLYEYKYIKPLEARKAEQDRKRKELKAQWDRCNKQVVSWEKIRGLAVDYFTMGWINLWDRVAQVREKAVGRPLGSGGYA